MANDSESSPPVNEATPPHTTRPSRASTAPLLAPLLPSHTYGSTLSTLKRKPTKQKTFQKHRVSTAIQPAGESGRKGMHLRKFLKICWLSTSRASRICNILWPVVPAALIVTYTTELHLSMFVLNYLAIIPCANLIGFGAQELARKLHKVFGVLVETTLGSVVEIVMFLVLVLKDQFQVIRAAILGSILATQLLCLGLCFVVGGIRHIELEFSPIVSEVGSDLLLTALVNSIHYPQFLCSD